MRKKILILVTIFILGMVFFINFAKADVISSEDALSLRNAFILGIAITAVIEVTIGYFLFLRNSRGLVALVAANLISYPLFFLFEYAFVPDCYSCNPIPYLILGEIAVVLIEMAIIKKIMGQDLSYGRALYISIILNIISVLVGLVVSRSINILVGPHFGPPDLEPMSFSKFINEMFGLAPSFQDIY